MSQRALLALSLVLLFAWPSSFAADVLPKAEVDRFMASLIDGQWVRGAVVGLVKANENDSQVQTQIIGYGKLSAADPRSPGGDTVFEIGSVTKAFTGLLLAEFVASGELSLDDPLQKHLPENVKLKPAGDRPITLLDLATHRSGLPSLPDNLKLRPDNPYADYTTPQMYAFLANHKPTRQPGERYEYSNFGAGLVGHLLARRAATSYEELVKRRITSKLDMPDTCITLGNSLRARFAPGHDADGGKVSPWDLPTLAGAGALRSTAADMLKFVAANMMHRPAELASAIRLSQQKHGSIAGDQAIGLFWHLHPKLQFLMHNGQTGGFHSYVAFSPAKKVGIVLLANTGTMHVDVVGDALLARLMDVPAKPPKFAVAVELAENALDRYVGTYEASPEFRFIVTRAGKQVFCQCTGQPKYRIYPQSETKFFWKVVDAEATFQRNDAGAVTSLTLHQGGANVPAKKLK